MKSLKNILSILCDLLEASPMYDRISLHTVKFKQPEPVEVKTMEKVSVILQQPAYRYDRELEGLLGDSKEHVVHAKSEKFMEKRTGISHFFTFL